MMVIAMLKTRPMYEDAVTAQYELQFSCFSSEMTVTSRYRLAIQGGNAKPKVSWVSA